MRKYLLLSLVLSICVPSQAAFKFRQLPSSGQLRTEASVTSVAFSPDGKVLAAATKGAVLLWDVTTGLEMKPLKGLEGFVNYIAFSPDSTLLATGGDGTDSLVKIWDVQSAEVKQTLDQAAATAPNGKAVVFLTALAFSPSGKALAAASSNKRIILWDMETGKKSKDFGDMEYPATSLWWSKDDAVLKAGGGGVTQEKDVIGETNLGDEEAEYHLAGEFNMWSVANGEVIVKAIIPRGAPNCSFSPDGALLAFSGDTVSIGTGEFKNDVPEGGTPYKASGVRLWRVPRNADDEANGKFSGNTLIAPMNSSARSTIAWAPDGSFLNIGHRLWDGRMTATSVARLIGKDTGFALDVKSRESQQIMVGRVSAISPDKRRVAQAYSQGIELWTLPE